MTDETASETPAMDKAAALEPLFRRLYDAFNARDIEAALALLHPEVDWPNGMTGGREHGREAVRAYWSRQFAVINSRVVPLGIEARPDGRTVVRVHQHVRDLQGATLSDAEVTHVYALRNGLIVAMDIEKA